MKSSASKKSETKPTETHDCPECGRHFGSMAGVLGHSWIHKYPKRSPSLRGGVRGPSTSIELDNPVELTAPSKGVVRLSKKQAPPDSDEPDAPATTKATRTPPTACGAGAKDKAGDWLCDFVPSHAGPHGASDLSAPPVWWENGGSPKPISAELTPATAVSDAVQRFKDDLPPLREGTIVRLGSTDYKVENGELTHVYFPRNLTLDIPNGAFFTTNTTDGFWEVRGEAAAKLTDSQLAAALAKIGVEDRDESEPDPEGDGKTEEDGSPTEPIRGPDADPSKSKGSHGLFDAEAAPPKMGEDSSAEPQSEAPRLGLFEVDAP